METIWINVIFRIHLCYNCGMSNFDAARLFNDNLTRALNLTGASLYIRQYGNVLQKLLALTVEAKDIYHYSPYCRICQKIESKSRCNAEHYIKIHELCISLKKPFINRCYAGVIEGVIPIYYKETMIGIITLSGCRTGDFDSICKSELKVNLAGLFNTVGINIKEAAGAYDLLSCITEAALTDVTIMVSGCIAAIMKVYEISNTDDLASSHRYVTEAKNHIMSRIGDAELSVESTAIRLNITREYLSRLFSRAAGVTAMDYILSARLERACLLLANTDISLKEVAWSSGFNDQAYFSRLFKSRMKITPSQYRSVGITGNKKYH